MAIKWIDVEYEVNGVTHKGKKQVNVLDDQKDENQVRKDKQQQLSFDTKTKTKEELKNYVATVLPNKDDVSMHHSFLMQCPLPVRRLPSDITAHTVQNGRISFMIEKGRLPILNKKTGRHVMTDMEVPSGAKARLVLSYINNFAYHNKTNVVEMGGSLRNFMEKNHVQYGGKNYKEMRQQIYNVAAANLWFNVANESNTQLASKKISISEGFLNTDDQTVKKVWQDKIFLTDKYYESLLKEKRPVDFRIMVLLQANPRAMDLYLWFTYRAPWLKFPLKLTYEELHALFGQSIKNLFNFKPLFFKAVAEVRKVYPALQLDLSKNDYVTIYKSESSVPRITGVGNPLFCRK